MYYFHFILKKVVAIIKIMCYNIMGTHSISQKMQKNYKTGIFMNFEYELNFFSDVLMKCHIHTATVSPLDSAESMTDPRFTSIVGFPADVTVGQMLGSIEDHTKYKLTNELNLQFVYMRLPLLSEKNIFVIGPYLAAQPRSKDLLEFCESARIPLGAQQTLKEYYWSVPVLTEGDRIFVMIDTFCERIWQTSSFAIVEHNKQQAHSMIRLQSSAYGKSFGEIEANVKMMEARYAFENEMMRAVSMGQQHKENLLLLKLNDNLFERRTADPLRNAKNYCIIMNTLLRKAAENGGVHPVYIDNTSSKFAARIEILSDVKSCASLMREMFSSYCRLVYKHSIRRYSPIVQKTILIVDSDISAELSLNSLAQKQGISAGYLATIFKKETGKTVSEYIKDKRIEHAMYLLGTTHLQIQTVALHCGIMDVQYFSKIFKKKIGKNPREYREALQR